LLYLSAKLLPGFYLLARQGGLLGCEVSGLRFAFFGPR